MPGIKRRVESGDDRGGKRTKVKNAPAPITTKSAKKNYVPPAFLKKGVTVGSRKTNKDKKAAKKDGKKKHNDEEDELDSEEDTDLSEDSDVDMDGGDNEVDDEDEEDAVEKAGKPDKSAAKSKGSQGNGSTDAEKSATPYLTTFFFFSVAYSHTYLLLIRYVFSRSARQAKSRNAGAQGSKAKCGLDRSIEEAVGTIASQVSCS
jgi:hypothetical protein